MNVLAKLPHILLVDGHPDTVRFTALFLTKHGFSVVSAYSLAEARDAAAKHQCDVLISSGSLRDGNGVELMRELKAKYGLPGILVSGSIEDGAAAQKEGFRFLAKPVDLKGLLDALQSPSAQ